MNTDHAVVRRESDGDPAGGGTHLKVSNIVAFADAVRQDVVTRQSVAVRHTSLRRVPTVARLSCDVDFKPNCSLVRPVPGERGGGGAGGQPPVRLQKQKVRLVSQVKESKLIPACNEIKIASSHSVFTSLLRE